MATSVFDTESDREGEQDDRCFECKTGFHRDQTHIHLDCSCDCHGEDKCDTEILSVSRKLLRRRASSSVTYAETEERLSRLSATTNLKITVKRIITFQLPVAGAEQLSTPSESESNTKAEDDSTSIERVQSYQPKFAEKRVTMDEIWFNQFPQWEM